MMMMMDSFILQYEHHTDEDSQNGGSDGSYISAQLIYIRAMKEWAAYTCIREKNEIFSYVFLERSLHILKRIKFEKYKKKHFFVPSIALLPRTFL